MAITNATRLADFGSGIGTEGAVIQVDNTNQRVGIGTTNPQAMFQVGTAVTVYGNSGIVSATSFYDSNGVIGGGGASKVYDSTIFAYQNIIENDITVESPYLTGTIYAGEDVTVDIEDGVTVTVDDGAVLNIITI